MIEFANKDENMPKLMNAIYRCASEEVEKILDEGMSLDVGVSGYDYHPLHLAAAKGDLAIIELLLGKIDQLSNKESIVSILDSHKRSPLHYACYGFNHEVAACLIQHGAEVNQATAKSFLDDSCNNNTPLMIALIAGFESIDTKNSEELTYNEKYKKTIEILLENGAKDKSNSNGDFALHYVNIESIANMIFPIAKENINKRNTQGLTPLAQAVQMNNLPIIKFLVKKGASITEIYENDNTLLHIAVMSAKYEDEVDIDILMDILELLSKHININTPNAKGETVLDLADKYCAEIINFLEVRGAVCNTMENTGGCSKLDESDVYNEFFGYEEDCLSSQSQTLYDEISKNEAEIAKYISIITNPTKSKEVEICISKYCKKISDLEQQNITLYSLLSESSFTESEIFSTKINNQKKTFQRIPTPGDGWCTFTAVGITDSISAINKLMDLVDKNLDLCHEIASIILHNCIASTTDDIKLNESFDMEKVDIGKNISIKLKELDILGTKIAQAEDQCEKDNLSNERKNKHNQFVQYLSDPSTCKAYLHSIKTNRYPHLGIAKAYMKYILGQQVCCIIKYGDKYVCSAFDDADDPYNAKKSSLSLPNPNEEGIVYVLYEPGRSMGEAHYSKLEKLDELPNASSFNRNFQQFFSPSGTPEGSGNSSRKRKHDEIEERSTDPGNKRRKIHN